MFFTLYKYNGKNQIIQDTNPLNDTTSYQYDENGELILHQKAKGDRIEYKFDQEAPESTVVVNGKKLWHYKGGDQIINYGELNPLQNVLVTMIMDY
ncbi:hypothetical protein ACIQ7N_01990 [Lysinibacillus sp. NPDC095746]|uniref:hypothetical protein n=1 Tax=Lysinibacillus sp. NPDC095746 TaxID=3364134 RepID=UPI00380CE40B